MSEGDVQPPTMKVAEAHNIGEEPESLGLSMLIAARSRYLQCPKGHV